MTRTSPGAAPITRADVGLRSERGPILLAVMLSVALVAIDSTILATAVPSIVGDLGGFAQFPWLFSIYLLAQAVSVPIYGKLSDQFGRKPIMLVGVGLFVLGSVLCGFAGTMGLLIAFRAIQGLGAGAVQPVAMTIIGDLYSIAERAKVQGYVASVWGIASVIGPTLGGVFSDFLDWRWIFFVNVPVGAVAAWMLARRFTEAKNEVTRHKIDFAGSALLTVGASLVILGLLEGGVIWSWTSLTSIAILAGGVLLLIAFGFNERHASEPILPGWVLRRRVLNGTSLASLTVGMIVIGLTSYIPLFVQSVLGHNALVGGFAVAALSVGWPLAASQSGRLYLRVGFRSTALIGSVFVVVGNALLLLLDCRQLGGAGRGHLLRHRRRDGPGGQPGPGRRPVDGRAEQPRRGHRHQHVRPLDGQRGRHRRIRGDRQLDHRCRRGRRWRYRRRGPHRHRDRRSGRRPAAGRPPRLLGQLRGRSADGGLDPADPARHRRRTALIGPNLAR